MQTRTERPPFYWLNEESRRFLSRDYLLPGISAEQRIRQIADYAEGILGIEGFGDKFYDYIARGWYSLATPVWTNFGLRRGCPSRATAATSRTTRHPSCLRRPKWG